MKRASVTQDQMQDVLAAAAADAERVLRTVPSQRVDLIESAEVYREMREAWFYGLATGYIRPVTCGHCKRRHPSIAQLRACAAEDWASRAAASTAGSTA